MNGEETWRLLQDILSQLSVIQQKIAAVEEWRCALNQRSERKMKVLIAMASTGGGLLAFILNKFF